MLKCTIINSLHYFSIFLDVNYSNILRNKSLVWINGIIDIMHQELHIMHDAFEFWNLLIGFSEKSISLVDIIQCIL